MMKDFIQTPTTTLPTLIKDQTIASNKQEKKAMQEQT